MRGGVLHHVLNGRTSKSLAARGGLPRTFGGLACFLAGIFLCLGIYILDDLFAHPIDAQAAALIVAAFVIALAILLLFYRFKPGLNSWRASHLHSRGSAALGEVAFPRETSRHVRRDDLRKDLAYQRVYVDPSRIRP
jgi:hypothetical protein